MSLTNDFSFNCDNDQLLNLVDHYLAQERDPTKIQQVADLKKAKDLTTLRQAFVPRIAFGTSGLRAYDGYGYGCINHVTVSQATQGLISYLNHLGVDKEKGIVVAFDCRTNSKIYAEAVVELFSMSGYKVLFVEKETITPIVPFAIKLKGLNCGVMITASHNPKEYNGYKLYWNNGCQINEPVDQHITNHILQNLDLWSNLNNNNQAIVECYNELWDLYFSNLSDVFKSYGLNQIVEKYGKEFRAAYTPLHGTGGPYATQVFKTLGLPNALHVVTEQFKSDSGFSTVKFPNPEENNVLDLVYKLAQSKDVNLVFANDPDADRFSMSEKQNNKEWLQFSGNQIGAMLAHFILSKYRQHSDNKNQDLYMINTCVSSSFIIHLAEKEGIKTSTTLTGFKYIGNVAYDLNKKNNTKVLFGFEESIGYMIDTFTFDKDGIIAVAFAACMAMEVYSKGLSLKDYLMQLYSQYGYFVNYNGYFLCYEKETILHIFNKIRNLENNTPKYPSKINHNIVISVRDLTIGYDSQKTNFKSDVPIQKNTQLITFKLKTNNDEIIELTLRTSGTEPKIKYYSELVVLSTTSDKNNKSYDFDQLQTRIKNVVNPVLEELIKPLENNLTSSSIN